MPLDFNLVGQSPRINTPFENLAQILQVRNQQEAARGLAEQRSAIADERRQKAEEARREAAAAAQVRALFSVPDAAPTPEALAAIIGPEKATEVFKGFEALKKSQWENQQSAIQGLASILGGIESLPEPLRAGTYQGARQNLIEKGLITAKDAPEAYDPAFVKAKRTEALSALEQFKQDAPIHVGDQLVKPNAEGVYESVYTPPEPKKPVTFGQPVEYMVNGRKSVVRPGSDGQLYSIDLKPLPAASVAPLPDSTGQPERPYVWVAKDGQMRFVTSSQAGQLSAQGWKPGNTREQGRPVTSGDAGRIAELDTSLDDVAVLRDALKGNKSTGTAAYVGTMLPNFVTEITGWGTDAKSKNAVIARVKQVIGKALEGGVLRKEDEIKYKDILPIISDPEDIVVTKINGLEAAIAKRRERELDAREDAGYDVTKFRERTSAPKTESVEHRVWRVGGKIGPEPK